MYEEYFGFDALPFQLTPDHRFFYDSSVHKKALAHLTFGMSQAEGFVVITGEVGAGKTTLIEHLIASINPDKFVVAKVVTSHLNADDLLKMIATALGINPENDSKSTLITRINQFMMSTFNRGKKVLLIVDEAQNLSFESLEELRMLSNLQVQHNSPIQTLLLGQPQFRDKLNHPDLDQLRQRVIASFHLSPLTLNEVKPYIEHRLKLVGWKGSPEFKNSAYQEIYKQTGGIPRKINTLCSRLLLHAFLDEVSTLNEKIVLKIAKERNEELGGSNLKKKSSQKSSDSKPLKLSKNDPKTKNLTKKVEALEKAIQNFSSFMKTQMKVK